MKIDEQWECWTLCAIKTAVGTYRGGEKGRHLWPRLVQTVAEGKTSYELSWKAKVMEKQKTRIAACLLLAAYRTHTPDCSSAGITAKMTPHYFQVVYPNLEHYKQQYGWVRTAEHRHTYLAPTGSCTNSQLDVFQLFIKNLGCVLGAVLVYFKL